MAMDYRMTDDDAELRAIVSRLIEREHERGERRLRPHWIAMQVLQEIAPAEVQSSYPLLYQAVLSQLRRIARSLCGLPEPEEDELPFLDAGELEAVQLEADALSRLEHAEALRPWATRRAAASEAGELEMELRENDLDEMRDAERQAEVAELREPDPR